MENEDTKFEEGSGDEFTGFIFSSEPKEKNTIKLELNPCEKNINMNRVLTVVHMFRIKTSSTFFRRAD